MSKKLFCLPGQVQRKVGNGSILPVTPLGVAQGVLRLTVGDILLKGRSGFILAALGFHGDDFSALEKYTDKQLAQLKSDVIRKRWQTIESEKTVDNIHQRQQP